ncbi:hypothetical protein [Sphingomonas quercus]|uniref:Uncharacterized protein n=1 Tax=Sphingomonas quercus TaxID=2842451 RepID=A0ABS6BL50_9SPHN|nr:hypothetical protein [Sphingomonas quercus]MBU3079048.1 hypothetical protein [Sphingomonas quercus]
MMKRALTVTRNRLSEMWHRVMAVTVDEGISWQQRRPPVLKAIVVITFAMIWMAIGYVVSGVVGRILARRDRRLG